MSGGGGGAQQHGAVPIQILFQTFDSLDFLRPAQLRNGNGGGAGGVGLGAGKPGIAGGTAWLQPTIDAINAANSAENAGETREEEAIAIATTAARGGGPADTITAELGLHFDDTPAPTRARLLALLPTAADGAGFMHFKLSNQSDGSAIATARYRIQNLK